MKRSARERDRAWQPGVVGQSGLRPWLQASGSLTARLKRRYADFAVQQVRQGWHKAHPDEWRLLGLSMARRAWVREVWLTGGGAPRVFAHSVICHDALRGKWRGLRSIGQRPLGAALFADARVRRGALHFYKLPLRHPLRVAVSASLPELRRRALWARRSLFHLGTHGLLVTEVFLPSLMAVK